MRGRRAGLSLITLAVAIAWTIGPARGQVVLEPAVSNLTFTAPVDIQTDGSDRLFVVERRGVIRVFDNVPAVAQSETFLDIRDRVDPSGGEMGLLGLVFHPDYPDNGFFFVNYTAGDPRRTVIARFEADPSNRNRALPDSETIILEVAQPYSNHNAGQLQFGPDGGLYIGLGDGGSGGDPDENGQDLSTLLGSMLRIDVDATSGGRNYGIPGDNPFIGANCAQDDCREEIWAYGFRNPWRFSFDPETERLWVADVGQNRYEEIDVVEPGGNYGWDIMEGSHCYEPMSGCDTTGLIPPVWEYSHSLGNSVTGGYVYRGTQVPELEGRYVFADFGSGRIWTHPADDLEAGATELMNTDLGITTLGVDAEGELYLVDYFSGSVYRFASDDGTSREESELPTVGAHLDVPHPNPSREAVSLRYEVDHAAHVRIDLYDVRGRHIMRLVDGVRTAGSYAAAWDGSTAEGDAVPSGVYLVRLTVDGSPAASRRVVRVGR